MARTDYGAILSTVIKDTSDAVREVNGTSSLIAPNQWGTAIRTMHSDSDYENALEQMIEEIATGDIASFSDGADNIPCPSVLCTINPVRSGTGDPSPSNIRPITGHTELNLGHTGKNLLNGEHEKTTQTDNGLIIPTGGTAFNFYMFSGKLPVGSVALYDPITGSNSTHQLVLAKNGSIFKYYTGGAYTFNVTSSDDTYTVRLYVYSGNTDTLIKPQMEIGSTSTAYEPYTGSTTTTDLGTTVYGGTLDVVSGVLTLTHEIKTCKWSDGISSTDLGSYNRRRFPFSSSNYGKYPPTSLDYIMCDKAPYLYNFNSDTLHFYYNSNEVLLFMPEDTDGDTLISVTLELATPTTIQLTPQEVKSLLGSNNIYHDCNGQVAVTYRANGQLYVEQHT